MKLSDYVKIYCINDNVYAYYHSLRMIPVYLDKSEHDAINEGRINSLHENTIDTLRKCRILIDDNEEDGLIERVQKLVHEPYICIAYFILTEQCNLSCKYCFLGNANPQRKTKVTDYPMSIETAEKALLFFAEQTRKIPGYFNDEKSIVFYGGEPLLNFETLRFTVEKCRDLQKEKIITGSLKFMMITNGLMLNRENIEFLRDNDVSVSVSIDGAGERANSSRVDYTGKIVYQNVLEKIKLSVSMGLNVSLSVTITEETMNEIDSLIEILNDTGIKSLCFNILQRTDDFYVDDDYYVRATGFITEFYRRTKSFGIYEERFMRKLKSFTSQNFYFHDCAASSGNQIVITPDGQVGICQGCTEKRKYFLTNINHPEYDICNDDTVQKFLKLSPVFREECRKCEALGLCGGGCPVNYPETFCTHAKMTLDFMIRELYSQMKNEKTR